MAPNADLESWKHIPAGQAAGSPLNLLATATSSRLFCNTQEMPWYDHCAAKRDLIIRIQQPRNNEDTGLFSCFAASSIHHPWSHGSGVIQEWFRWDPQSQICDTDGFCCYWAAGSYYAQIRKHNSSSSGNTMCGVAVRRGSSLFRRAMRGRYGQVSLHPPRRLCPDREIFLLEIE